MPPIVPLAVDLAADTSLIQAAANSAQKASTMVAALHSVHNLQCTHKTEDKNILNKSWELPKSIIESLVFYLVLLNLFMSTKYNDQTFRNVSQKKKI